MLQSFKPPTLLSKQSHLPLPIEEAGYGLRKEVIFTRLYLPGTFTIFFALTVDPLSYVSKKAKNSLPPPNWCVVIVHSSYRALLVTAIRVLNGLCNFLTRNSDVTIQLLYLIYTEHNLW